MFGEEEESISNHILTQSASFDVDVDAVCILKTCAQCSALVLDFQASLSKPEQSLELT